MENGRKSPAHHALGSVIFLIWMLIYLVTFVAGLYALVEAVRTPASAFELMDKQTKKLWVILTGVATGLSGIAVFTGRGVLIVMCLVVILIYLLDVRPAVKGAGNGSNNGPYGPW